MASQHGELPLITGVLISCQMTETGAMAFCFGKVCLRLALVVPPIKPPWLTGLPHAPSSQIIRSNVSELECCLPEV